MGNEAIEVIDMMNLWVVRYEAEGGDDNASNEYVCIIIEKWRCMCEMRKMDEDDYACMIM